MRIKDILVHVDSTPSARGRVDLAARIAAQNDAHLAGLHVLNAYYDPGSSRTTPGQYFAEWRGRLERNAAAARAHFESATRGAGVVCEWRDAGGSPAEVVARHARYSDLTIVGQRNAVEDGQSENLPDDILLTTGRPVLIVPRSDPLSSFARRVIVAWDDSVPATRAVNDAIPLISDGATVEVLAINPDDAGDHGPIPCADICLHLARHGIAAQALSFTARHIDVGRMLLAHAHGKGCDLLVMGAYGHSRRREFVLGGVTDHVLSRATMPILTSH